MTQRHDPSLADVSLEACCEGVRVETPRALSNRPGLDAIRYRSGTQPLFKETLLARLSRSDAYQALSRFSARTDDDFTIALLDAWATVADVITFYQERIANEAYLRTATERYSVWQLARLVGYELKPGLAAAAHLVFFVDEADAPRRDVSIPVGTPVQSTPTEPETLPETFETVEEITARSEWNRLRPRLTRAQSIRLQNESVHFAGANLNIRVGDTLLFVHKDLDNATNPSLADARWNVRQVTQVDPPDALQNRTTVRWSWKSGTSERNFLVATAESTDNLAAYVFRTRANVFGHNAPDWRTLPDAARATYLGVPDVQELLEEERLEWPQFLLRAPMFPHSAVSAPPPTRTVEPTVASIVAAVKAVTDETASAFNSTALMSIPDAAIKTFAVVTEIISAVAGIATDLIQSGSESTIDLIGSVMALVDFLVEVVSSLLPEIDVNNIQNGDIFRLRILRDDDGTPTAIETWNENESKFEDWPVLTPNFFLLGDAIFTTAGNIVRALTNWATGLPADLSGKVDVDRLKNLLNSFIEKNPVFASLAVLNSVMSGNAFDGVDDRVSDAVSAMTAVPDTMAQAAGANIVGKVVATTVETVANAPLPELLRTPQTVALAAVASAKITVAAINGTFVTPQEAQSIGDKVNAIIGNLIGNDGSVLDELLPQDELLADLVGDDAEDFLAAAAGGTALAAGTVAASVVPIMLALSPVYAPVVAPLFLIALALDASVEEGAKRMEAAIRKAVKAALYPPDEILSPRRPLHALATDAVDLDTTYPGLVPESWLLLSLPNRSTQRFNQEALFRINGVTTASRSDFTLNDKVTRASLSGMDFSRASPALESRYVAEVRNTTVFCRSERLTFAGEPDPTEVPGDRIELERHIPDMKPGRRLIAIGAAAKSGAQVRELLTLKHCEHDDRQTALILETPLATDFRRDGLTLLGNVARATHGESKTEVLGSGDASQVSQTFSLREPPVTNLVSDAVPGGFASTLEVRVNAIRWDERPFLFGAGARERAFETTLENDGNVGLRFGDGVNGARLHTGSENVVAHYRSGAGEAGNVDADALSLFLRRPLGVNEVSNPLPALGGVDPERIEDARRNVPITTSLLERIVSLQDYEDFVRGFPGIGKALATWALNRGDRAVLVTAARGSGEPITASDPDNLLTTLLKAIRVRSDRRIAVRIRGYRRVGVHLEANLMIDQAHDRERVKQIVEARLRSRFAFQTRQFGQPFTLSEAIAVIQAVNGVVAVDIDRLYRNDQAPGLNSRLPAAGPCVGAHGKFAPAELLVLDSVDMTDSQAAS